MMRSEAVVVAICADTNEVIVEAQRAAGACGSCTSKDRCPSGAGDTGDIQRYRVPNSVGAGIGDHVGLIVADGTVLRAAWYSYLLPVILVLSCATVGDTLAGDVGAAVGTLTGLVMAFVLLRVRNNKYKGAGTLLRIDRFQPGVCDFPEAK